MAWQYARVEDTPYVYPLYTALQEATEALRDAEWDNLPTAALERKVAYLEALRDQGIEYVPTF